MIYFLKDHESVTDGQDPNQAPSNNKLEQLRNSIETIHLQSTVIDGSQLKEIYVPQMVDLNKK